MHQHATPGRSVGQDVGESDEAGDVEAAMNAGPPEITIHQEGPPALLCVRQRQMNGGGRFPFRRGGTGDHQGTDAAVEVRQGNGVAESADGLLKCAEARGRFAQWNQRGISVSRRKSSSMPLLY